MTIIAVINKENKKMNTYTVITILIGLLLVSFVVLSINSTNSIPLPNPPPPPNNKNS